LRQTAETTPSTRPSTTDQAIAATVSHSVGAKRSAISSDTSRFVRIERPKSPCSACPKKRTN